MGKNKEKVLGQIMDIQVYDSIFNGLKEYNDSVEQNYGNDVVRFAPVKPSYPLTVLEEIRNVANPSFNSCFDRVSSIGYRVDIYAKTKGNMTKQKIARIVAQIVDKYMTNIGLLRVSYNVIELENDSSIYHIIMTYAGNLHENRNRLV